MSPPHQTPRASALTGPRSSGVIIYEEASPRSSTPASTPLTERIAVPVVFLVFVIMRAMDRVFNKRVSDRMKDYQLFYINVLWPVGVQLLTVIMVCIYVVYRRKADGDLRYDWRFLLPGSKMASGAGAVALWRLGFFSFFDQLNASIGSLATPFIDMTSQNILNNLVIVWTVLISMWYLQTRYHQVHYLACVLVVISGIVAVTVEVQTDQDLGEYKTASGEMKSSSPLWYFIFILSTVPAGMSNCYKQKMLQNLDLEVMYATLWSGNIQILWGLVFFPMNWIPLPNLDHNYPQDTGKYFSDGWTCFIGNSPIPDDPANVCAAAGGSAAEWFIVYLGFNLSFNVLLLWLTKRMSGTWAAIGTVLCQDLSSIFSMSRTLMGDEAQNVTFEQYVGLAVAAVAMWAYNIEEEVRGDDESEGAGGLATSEAPRTSLVHFPSFASDCLVSSFASAPSKASALLQAPSNDVEAGLSQGISKHTRAWGATL